MKNQKQVTSYHLATRCVHWLSAFTIIGLFVLGLWMVDLDYYDPWYKTAPDWHRSVGLSLALFTCLRLALYVLPSPKALDTHARLEKLAALITKTVMLALLFCMFISGYLITTATGDPIYVFNWFSLPSLWQFEGLEDIAGEIHELSAWTLIVLAGLHALAAIKHHFMDKDATLKRMIFGNT